LDDVPRVAACTIDSSDPRHEDIETRCDGVDNDCDGLVDTLLPIGPNACDVQGAQGVCAHGWAACANGMRVCMARSAAPEVANGVDDDCNGVVDDVAMAQVHARALVMPPPNVYLDEPEAVANVTLALDQWGVPYETLAQGASWDDALARLASYSLVVIPGPLDLTALTSARRSVLEGAVRAGVVAIVFDPVGEDGADEVLRFVGASASDAHMDAASIVWDGASAPATREFDSPEERVVPLADDPTTAPIPVQVLTADTASGAVVLAHANALDGHTLGAIATRRPLGSGAVYALGHDLASFASQRCYINCYEPSGDTLGLFLRDALRESAHGHVVLKHTVPGREDSVLLLSHDVDAPDAHNAGPWGQAGAVQMASLERGHAARGTFLVTTDYVVGYWNPDMARQLCDFGMCTLGAHSVRHALDVGMIPFGTGNETQATYDALGAETISGEVRVSVQLLADTTSMRPRSWRSPYLAVNPRLFDALSAANIIADSSYAVGDIKTNVPFSVGSAGFNQDVFHHQTIYEFPISCEDGLGSVDPNGVDQRTELQEGNVRQFLSLWSYDLWRNAQNGAITVALIHPSYGVGVGPENLRIKLLAADRLLRSAEAAGARTDLTMEQLADFYRGRDATVVDASYDTSIGYRGTLHFGAVSVQNLTLEFGDVIHAFSCAACGPFEIAGNRVVLTSARGPNATATFTARP
jgi:hypothetical protein